MPQGTSRAPGSKAGPEDADRQDPGSHRAVPLQRTQESTRREKRTREHSANRVRSTRRRDGQVSLGASSVNQGRAHGWTSGLRGPFREVDVRLFFLPSPYLDGLRVRHSLLQIAEPGAASLHTVCQAEVSGTAVLCWEL